MAVERADAVAGQAVTLRMAFRQNGVLIDPFEVRQVQILDKDFAVLETIPAASIVHDSAGRYHVDWTIPSDRPSQVHRDRWFTTLESSGCAETEFTLAFFVLPAAAVTGAAPSYITLAEARAYLPEGSTISDSDLQKIMNRCQAAIERICGQKFAPVSETRIFDGRGIQTLNLRRAIQEVTAITVDGNGCGCNGDTGHALDISGIRISGSRTMLACGNLVPYPYRRRWSGLDRFSCDTACCVFPMGFQNIRVTGSWGSWSEPPEEIKHALGLLIQHVGKCDDPRAPHTAAYSAEGFDGWDYTVRQIWHNVVQDATTGFAEVDSILARYYHPPIVVGVV